MAQKNRNYYTSENLNASNQKIRSNLYNDVKQHSNQENHIQSKHSRKPERRLSFKNLMLSALVMFCVTIVSFTLNIKASPNENFLALGISGWEPISNVEAEEVKEVKEVKSTSVKNKKRLAKANEEKSKELASSSFSVEKKENVSKEKEENANQPAEVMPTPTAPVSTPTPAPAPKLSASEYEVQLLAKLIYREMHGYYEEPSWYGLTKTQGLRAAIITGCVVRNRRDNQSTKWSNITEVLAARNQYGAGGQSSISAIEAQPLSQDFYNIAYAILCYNEQSLAQSLVGNEPDYNKQDFQIPANVFYQSQYSSLGSSHYAAIGNQVYDYK